MLELNWGKRYTSILLTIFYGCFVSAHLCICLEPLSPRCISVKNSTRIGCILRVSVWWLMIWQRWYFLWELVGTFVQLSQYLAFLAHSFQLHMFPHSYQRRSLISRLPKIFHIINYHFSKLNSFQSLIIITLILITQAMSALIWLRVSASKTCGASSLPGLRH